VEISFPIKGNAYGHGLEEMAQIAEDYVDYFQVDDIEELGRLRKVSSKKTLVIGYVAASDLENLVQLGGIPVLYDIKRIRLLNSLGEKLNKQISFHLKIDVYHGRQGILLSDVQQYIDEVKHSPFLHLEGIAAHFSSSDDPNDSEHTTKQIETFKEIKKRFHDNGVKVKSHISNTGGIFVYEKDKKENEIVRIGIGLYGIWPSQDLQNEYETNQFKLKPVARWVTHVAQVKELPTNYPVGYNRTFITSQPTKVALIPQGYSDGYDRSLSNKGEVLIQGTRCKVLGRVAMNMFSVDVSHLEDVYVENEVVLLGKQGNEEITAEEIASNSTINYEVTTRISALLPKVIVE
jgi:alanine racemase